MSSNGHIVLPPKLTKIEAGDESWEMDVLGTILALEEADNRREELDLAIRLVQEAGGPEMSYDQADAFIDTLMEAQAKKKRVRKESFDATLKSPSSSA